MREFRVTVTFSTIVTADSTAEAQDVALDQIAVGNVAPIYEIEEEEA